MECQVDMLHRHEGTGQPWGEDAFIEKLEIAAKRILRPQKPGPKKNMKGWIGSLCLVEHVAVSDLCDEYHHQPRIFYCWQKQFFENGSAAFVHFSRTSGKSADSSGPDNISNIITFYYL